MDKLKKTIELIGSHQNVLSHYVVDPGVNLTTQEMFDVLIKEIERLTDLNKAKGALIKAQAKKIGMLLKEKEWLLGTYALDVYIGGDRLDDHELDNYKNEILENMRQALEEK